MSDPFPAWRAVTDPIPTLRKKRGVVLLYLAPVVPGLAAVGMLAAYLIGGRW